MPVRNFFLGQSYYEEHDCFPNGNERPHAEAGIIEAYADILGMPPQVPAMIYMLRILSAKSTKGHWVCPCGSALVIRKCCHKEVSTKRQKIGQSIAKKMLKRLRDLEKAR